MRIEDLSYALDERNRPGKSSLIDSAETLFVTGSFAVQPTGTVALPRPLTGFLRQWTHINAALTAGVGAANDRVTLARVVGDSTGQVLLMDILIAGGFGLGVNIPLLGVMEVGFSGFGLSGTLGIVQAPPGGFLMGKNEFLNITASFAGVGTQMNVAGWYKDYPV